MVRTMYIRSLLGRGAESRRLAHDPDEALRVEARAADQGAVDLGLRQEHLGVLGLDAATVQDANGLRDLLRRQLGEQAAVITLHLGGLGRRGGGAGAGRPYRVGSLARR